MENKYLQETTMSLSPDTVDNPKTGGGNNTGSTGNDGGNTGGD